MIRAKKLLDGVSSKGHYRYHLRHPRGVIGSLFPKTTRRSIRSASSSNSSHGIGSIQSIHSNQQQTLILSMVPSPTPSLQEALSKMSVASFCCSMVLLLLVTSSAATVTTTTATGTMDMQSSSSRNERSNNIFGHEKDDYAGDDEDEDQPSKYHSAFLSAGRFTQQQKEQHLLWQHHFHHNISQQRDISQWSSWLHHQPHSCKCEASASVPTTISRTRDAAAAAPPPPTTTPSWLRRILYHCGLVSSLPLPRLLTRHDPDLILAPHLIRQRQADEAAIAALQRKWQQEQQTLAGKFQQQDDQDAFYKSQAAFVMKLHEILYGMNVTPQHRLDFLARYGCTGWTNDVLDRLVDLGCEGHHHHRGIVEIGAGHGQWARALTEHWQHKKQQKQNQQQLKQHRFFNPQRQQQQRDFVLAYDDASQLPLNPNIYHAQTQPHADYFGKVEILLPTTTTNYSNGVDDDKKKKKNTTIDYVAICLSQWRNRGRVLLLVFPPPHSDMAFHAATAYAALGPENDVIVYVGEGRGGAHANDAFFDFLTGTTSTTTDADNSKSSLQIMQHQQQQQTATAWILVDILPVKPFGTKGYEKLYIFQKAKSR